MYTFVDHCGDPYVACCQAAKKLETLERENNRLTEENRKMRFMIDNGLGWEDMINDCL